MFAKILMIVIFFAITVGVGLWCRRQATDVNGFVLGGRAVGPWLTAFAYGTSYFSAVVFVGYAGQFGWKFGMAATWAGIGNAIIGSLLAWVVLGRRTRIMTQHLGAKTMPEFFEKRYGSTALKLTGVPDPGPLTTYGVPAVRAISEIATVITIGSLFFAAFCQP